MQEIQKSTQGYATDIEIPFNWKIVKLGDVLEVQGGYAFKSSDYVDSGVKLIRITNISFGWTNLKDLSWLPLSYLERYKDFSLAEDDIVIVLTRPIIEGGIKAARIMRDALPALLNQRIARFKIIERDRINQGFLYYIIFSPNFTNYIKKRLGVTNQPNISAYEIEKISIPIPPIEEQQKIASILSKVDELIQKTDQVIEQTQRLKKGLMHRLLTKGIGHTRFKEIVFFPTYVKEMIPEEWHVAQFSDISKRITYGFTNPMPHTEGGPWLVTAKDIKNGRINYGTAQKTSLKSYREELTDKSRPKVGVVLITKDGTLGEVAIVDRDNICINQSVASIEPNHLILPEYLALALQSYNIKKIIDVFSPATTIMHISITDLAKWRFGLPSLNEQQTIVSIISLIDRQVQSEQNYKLKVENLKKGLMQKLLTGKIRFKV